MTKKLKIKIKKMSKKFIACIMILAMVYSYFVPIANVFADGEYIVTFTTNDNHEMVNDNGNLKIDGQYVELRDSGNNRIGVVSCSNSKSCTITVDDGTASNLNYNSGKKFTLYMQNHQFDMSHTFSANENIVVQDYEEENEVNSGPDGPSFDGKAYVIWSCGNGTCYHYFDKIPDFEDGYSTFYKDTEIKADNNESIHFDVNAEYKAWAMPDKFNRWQEAYKEQNNVENINWAQVDPEDIISENPPRMDEWEAVAIAANQNNPENGCARPNDGAPRTEWEQFQSCVDEYYIAAGNLPFIRLQPVGEPEDNNAYVSYGDRNFKVVIYNDKYKGITIGDLSDLNYYPAEWANPFIRQDQFDISCTTKEKPTYVNSILLEKTLNIKTLNYNGFEITELEALDVPSDAVSISKVNGEWKLVFSSHFYDNVVFKATDNNGEVSYFAVKRSTVDAWINNVEEAPHLYAEVYYDRNNTYTDFDLTAKIIYKDGTIANIELTHYNRVDDGLGNIAVVDEVDQEESEYGESGKGLKKAVFIYKLPNGKTDRDIKDAYINIEYKGSTSDYYAGAYAGSGKGILANIYHGEDE